MAQSVGVDVALRSPESRARFLRVWTSSFGVFLATGLGLFGLNWWIARSPGGGGMLGVVVGVSSALSTVVVVLVSGMIDTVERRRFLLRTKGVLALSFVVLVPVYVLGAGVGLTLAAATVSYLLLESAHAVYMAALETTVADLAPSSWSHRRTASLITLQPQIERVVSPLIGSVLITAASIVALPVVSIVGVAVAAAVVVRYAGDLEGLIQTSPGAGSTRGGDALRSSLADARHSLSWIRARPLLPFLLVIGVLANLIVFPFYALLPAFLSEYGLSERAHSLLYGQAASAYGVGMLVSTTLLAGLARKGRRPAETCALTVMAICGVLAAMTLPADPRVVVPGMAVVGVVFTVLVAVAGGAWLELTPSNIRARVFGLRRLVAFSSIPLGTSLMGFGGAAAGYRTFVRVLVIVVAAGVALSWALYVTSTRRAHAPVDDAPPP